MKNVEKTNEQLYVEECYDFMVQLHKVLHELKELFGVDSRYDEDNSTLQLIPQAINEALTLANAKQYALQHLNEAFCSVSL